MAGFRIRVPHHVHVESLSEFDVNDPGNGGVVTVDDGVDAWIRVTLANGTHKLVKLGGAQITFGLINTSTVFFPPNYKYPGSPSTKVITDDDCKIIARAISTQLAEHFGPSWPEIGPAVCVFVPSDELDIFENPNWYPIVISDETEYAIGALGDHSMQGDIEMSLYPPVPGLPVINGRPMAYVATRATTDALCDVFFDPFTVADPSQCVAGSDPSISIFISHEVMEILGDSNVMNLAVSPPFLFCESFPTFYFGGDATTEGAPFVGVSAIREIVDPVESDWYTIMVGEQPVAVSNFVKPSWFNTSYWAFLHPESLPENMPGGNVPGALEPPSGTTYDWLGNCSEPWQLSQDRGGYMTFTVIPTSGTGPILTPPQWQNPDVAPSCDDVVPPPDPPPGSARVALATPGFEFGNAIVGGTGSIGPTPTAMSAVAMAARLTARSGLPFTAKNIVTGKLPYRPSGPVPGRMRRMRTAAPGKKLP